MTTTNKIVAAVLALVLSLTLFGALYIHADEYTTYDVDAIDSVDDFEFRHVVGEFPVTPTGDYLTVSHTHKTNAHRGKCVFTCGECCFNYLDKAGKILFIDGNRVYYTGYTIGQLQLTAPDASGWKNVRAIYGLSYGSSIVDPPLVTLNEQSYAGSLNAAARFSLPADSAGFTSASQTAILQSLVDYCMLMNYSRFFGVYAVPITNASTCCMVALVATSGSLSLSRPDGDWYLTNPGSSTLALQPLILTAYGWKPTTQLNVPAGRNAIGTSSTITGVLTLARLYPVLAAGNQGNPNVYPFTGTGLLPAQQDTAHPYQYTGFTSVAAARISGTLYFDSEISTLYDWLAVRHVYNMANVQTSSDKEYTQAEYDAYGSAQYHAGVSAGSQEGRAIGRQDVISNPHNPPQWDLFTAEEVTEAYTDGYSIGYNDGLRDAPTSEGDVVVLDVPAIADTVIAAPMTFLGGILNPFDTVLGISIAGLIALLSIVALIIYALHVVKKVL